MWLDLLSEQEARGFLKWNNLQFAGWGDLSLKKNALLPLPDTVTIYLQLRMK